MIAATKGGAFGEGSYVAYLQGTGHQSFSDTVLFLGNFAAELLGHVPKGFDIIQSHYTLQGLLTTFCNREVRLAITFISSQHSPPYLFWRSSLGKIIPASF